MADEGADGGPSPPVALAAPAAVETVAAGISTASPVGGGRNAVGGLWARWGCPRAVASPMVDQSELAFRLLVRRYGVGLAYTPMLHARRFVDDATYRHQFFFSQTLPAGDMRDRPLVVQFAGHDAGTLIAAARLVRGHVDAVGLNLGCPERVAKKGGYGAFLLDDPDRVVDLVRNVAGALRGWGLPLTCKIRVMLPGPHIPSSRRGVPGTVAFCRRLEAAGCAALCVHGRHRQNKGPRIGAADWDAVRAVKQAVGVPVVANGGVQDAASAARCAVATGCDGVMSAEALLADPALFGRRTTAATAAMAAALRARAPKGGRAEGADGRGGGGGGGSGGSGGAAGRANRADGSGDRQETAAKGGGGCGSTTRTGRRRRPTPTQLALEYLELCERHPTPDFRKFVKPHLVRMLHGLLPLHAQSGPGTATTPPNAFTASTRKTTFETQLQQAGNVVACREVVQRMAASEATVLADECGGGEFLALQDGGAAGGASPVPVAPLQRLLQSWYMRHRSRVKVAGGGHDHEARRTRKAARRGWAQSGTCLKK